MTIDFDIPDETESQRYTLVEQLFIECITDGEPNVPIAKQKMEYLRDHHFASSPRAGKVLILARRTKDVDMIEYCLNHEMKVKSEKTHGTLRQDFREQAMYSFKTGQVEVLVATMNLGGRGINVNGVAHLVLWDLPTTLEESKSCLGRVGRLGNKASCTAFYTERDYSGVMNKEMKTFLEKNKQAIPTGLAEVGEVPIREFDVDIGAGGAWGDTGDVSDERENTGRSDTWQ